MTFGVVVEVDVDVTAFGEPALRIRGPRAQALLAVARRVFARVTVQPHVDHVRGDLAPHRKVRRVAHAHRDVARAQDLGDLGHEPRFVTQLERVPYVAPRFERAHEVFEPFDAALKVAR
jgi:hypothetical protein